MSKPFMRISPADSANYSIGRGGSEINRIIIHTQQGTAAGTENWFQNPEAHASAHFGISFDGDITQFVQEENTAWHAGNGPYNRCSVGIELEGFMERGYFPDTMVDGLVTLCKYLCETYDIPHDRAHIIGHAEVPDPKNPGEFGGTAHHKDPGPAFPWDTLMEKLQASDDQAVS